MVSAASRRPRVKAETNLDSNRFAGSLKNFAAGGGIQAQLRGGLPYAIRPHNGQGLFLRQPINDRHLTTGKGEFSGLQKPPPFDAGHVVENKVGRPGHKLILSQKAGAEVDFSVFDRDAQLAHATDQILLDLSRKSRLARPRVTRCVRIGIHRECPVNVRRLVIADTGADLVITIRQPFQDLPRRVGVHRAVIRFLYREQKLGNHVPVDASQSLVAEECAGTAGEGFVVEQPLKDSQHERSLAFDEAGVGSAQELIENAADVTRVRDGGVEMNPPGNIAFDKLPPWPADDS